MESEERHLQERSSGPRYVQLDALRGLAAVCVVFFHCDRAFHLPPVHFWAVPLLSGTQAVDLFFVLSGFVLSLPYVRGKRSPYWPYLIRRFWRIYVPFAAAVLLSALGAALFRGYHLPLTPWYYVTWQTPVTAWLIVKHLLMVPLSSLNTAFWSLSVEVQLSILMPFLAMGVRRAPAAVSLVCVAVWVGLLAPAEHGTFHLSWRTFPFIEFGPLFLIGSIVAKYQEKIREFFQRIGAGAGVVLIVSLVLYCNYQRTNWKIYPFLHLYQGILSGLGGAGLIVCALYMPRFARVLEHSVPEYLGRISYSLYLTHSVVLFALLDLLYGRVPVVVLVAIILAAALGLAHVFCITIEEPANRAGKRLATRKPQASLRERVLARD